MDNEILNVYHACRLAFVCGDDKIPWHMVLHAIRQGLRMTAQQTHTLTDKDFKKYPRLKELVDTLHKVRD